MVLGGSRITGFTVSLIVMLTVYTTLVSGVLATYTDSTFTQSESRSFLLDSDIGLNFDQSESLNISKPSGLFDTEQRFFTDLSPDRKVEWKTPFMGEESYFEVRSKGIGFPAQYLFYTLSPSETTEQKIIDTFDNNKNYTLFTYNQGGKLETYVAYFPQLYYNETDNSITYLYDGIEEALDEGELTLLVGVNMTNVDYYDVGKLTSMLVGFGAIYTGIPFEVNVIISGIWWAMFILLGIKLVVG